MEKNKIYIPINIQTETMIFQGYGMSDCLKHWHLRQLPVLYG